MNELTVALLVVLLFGVGLYVHGHYFVFCEGMRLKEQIEKRRDDPRT